jgi:uncharacterized Zn finger protein
MGYWDYYPRYERKSPKPVKDGLKARKKTGQIGETWWAKRFLEVLDGFGWSNRLDRGRRYARAGQVIDYKIGYGLITSKVQGSQTRPYSIEIKVKTLQDKEWQEVIKAMSAQVRFSASLLAGQMPQDIEEVFKKAKVSLFPTSEKDFKANCSCPDWANPCKHIAAACYIIGEAFDRDPFLIFYLRGKNKEDVLGALQKEGGIVQKQRQGETEEEKEEPAEPLTDDPVTFWKEDKGIEHHFSLKPPSLNAALLHRLGVPQFFLETEEEFYKTMENVYEDISKEAVKIAYTAIEEEKEASQRDEGRLEKF